MSYYELQLWILLVVLIAKESRTKSPRKKVRGQKARKTEKKSGA